MKKLVLMFAVLVASTTAYLGCKQQDGERCQVNEDCETGLCNKAKGTCASGTNMNEIDASVPDGPDAPPMMPDAMTDAMVDAP